MREEVRQVRPRIRIFKIRGQPGARKICHTPKSRVSSAYSSQTLVHEISKLFLGSDTEVGGETDR